MQAHAIANITEPITIATGDTFSLNKIFDINLYQNNDNKNHKVNLGYKIATSVSLPMAT